MKLLVAVFRSDWERGSVAADTRIPLVGGKKNALGRPGILGLIAVCYPAASDLTARYEDVRTQLYGLSIVLSFYVTASVPKGAAISAIRDSPRMFSVRTEDLPPGLLLIREPP